MLTSGIFKASFNFPTNRRSKRSEFLKVHFSILIELVNFTFSLIDFIIIVIIALSQNGSDVKCGEGRSGENICIFNTIITQIITNLFDGYFDTIFTLFEVIQLIQHKDKTITRLLSANLHTVSNMAKQVAVVIYSKLCCIQDIQNDSLGGFGEHAVSCRFMFWVSRIVWTGSIYKNKRDIFGGNKRNIAFDMDFRNFLIAVQRIHDIKG